MSSRRTRFGARGPRTPRRNRLGRDERQIAVENPASGETIATVPELGADEVARDGRARPAPRSPPGRRSASRAAREVLLAARRWMVANGERVVTTICAETGRPADETQFAELAYGLSALEFWAKQAPPYLADEEIDSASPFVRGRKLSRPLRAARCRRRDRPWNFPLNNSFGDCIPALAAGNAVVLKPSEITPLTSLLMAEMLAECGAPDGVFQVATGRGETGAALVDEVDFVMFTGSVATGKKVMAQAAADADPGQPRARRQGPDDRPRRRRPRARGQLGHLLRAQQLGPGLHLGRADLRRGRDPRRVPRAADREGRGPAPGPARRGRLRRRRRDHLRPADRADRGARRTTPSTRARRCSPAAPAATGRAASSSRPCSPRSTTRCAA